MKFSIAKLNKTQVKDVYSQMAPVYDIWGSLTETKARQRAISLANIKNGEAVLEVAVGTGLTFQEILQANPDGENIGIDLTPAMLEKAKSKALKSGANNFKLVIGDAYHLQFPDAHFDLLMNNYMFDLLPEEDFLTVLKEFKRVLKPGGRLVLINMTRSDRQKFWEGVYRFNPSLLGGCRGVLLTDYLLKVGFTQITRELVSQLGFQSEVISASN